MDPQVPRLLATAYARCMDDRNFADLEQIMVADVVVAAQGFECTNLAAFQEQVQLLNKFSATLHLLGNQFGDWDGDNYHGETYCVATHIYEEDGVGRKWEVGIRYQDDISLIDGVYKYTRRYLNVLWDADVPLRS